MKQSKMIKINPNESLLEESEGPIIPVREKQFKKKMIEFEHILDIRDNELIAERSQKVKLQILSEGIIKQYKKQEQELLEEKQKNELAEKQAYIYKSSSQQSDQLLVTKQKYKSEEERQQHINGEVYKIIGDTSQFDFKKYLDSL